MKKTQNNQKRKPEYCYFELMQLVRKLDHDHPKNSPEWQNLHLQVCEKIRTYNKLAQRTPVSIRTVRKMNQQALADTKVRSKK